MKPRICVYISEEAAARLLAEARRRGVSKSFLVRAALDQLLGGPDCEAIDHSAMMRRLNWMSRQLEHLDRDLRVVNETVALHARYHLTVTPPLSPPIRQAACKLGAARFDEFAAQVGRRVHLGMPLMRETMERVSETSPHSFNAQQSGVEPDLHAAHDVIDDNVFAMTPSRPAAVGEDGSDGSFPAANGNSGSWVGHGSPERTS
ncbi:MAG: ribbon-helix-helix protein, CopG family [Pseudorhodoplanes sp.]|uniref:ribbon-helix-helix protein, CopG family n=1 Tax=Pseudorhodoplanes sp. TaxID=1934341 RepID=UPI003D13B807